MTDWLDKLREKPEPLRRAVAFWVSAFVVFVIVSVWLGGLPGRIGSVKASLADAIPKGRISVVASPFASMKAELDTISESVQGSFEYVAEEIKKNESR